jgi:hypothetical protein
VGSKKGKRKGEVPKRPKLASGGRESSTSRALPASRREQRFTTIVPVRFEPAMLEAVRASAAADGRPVSAWIRRAVEAELRREASGAAGAGTTERRADVSDDAR